MLCLCDRPKERKGKLVLSYVQLLFLPFKLIYFPALGVSVFTGLKSHLCPSWLLTCWMLPVSFPIKHRSGDFLLAFSYYLFIEFIGIKRQLKYPSNYSHISAQKKKKKGYQSTCTPPPLFLVFPFAKVSKQQRE